MTEQFFVERDPFAPINYRYPIKRVLHERKSPIQEIKVLESEFFGRMMTLDDVVQLTEHRSSRMPRWSPGVSPEGRWP